MSNREYPTQPLVAVGAVIFHGEHVLLVRRGHPPGMGRWTLPGGLVELGEPVREALARELQEECGVETRVGPLIDIAEVIEKEAPDRVRLHFVILDFLAAIVAGELCPGSDIAEACWASWEELPNYGVSAAVLRMVERGRNLRAAWGEPTL